MNWALLNEVGFLPLLPACANAGQGLLDGGSLFGGRGTTTMSFITRRRAVDQRPATQGAHELRATLRWPHLMALGVGAIVGTGIYTLTGVGAGLAGPVVILSFAIAGGVCTLAALCYAEMATLMPHAGSA